jgi:hypothetical protein
MSYLKKNSKTHLSKILDISKGVANTLYLARKNKYKNLELDLQSLFGLHVHSCARNYRQSFRENIHKTLVFYD